MVSGVSFKNTPEERIKTSSRAAAGGIALLFGIICMALALWGAAYFYKSSVDKTSAKLTQSIDSTRSAINTEVNGPPQEYIARSRAVSNTLYRGVFLDGVVSHFSQSIVPGIVLQSVGQTIGDGGESQLDIVADARQYDEVAAQIAAWKSYEEFSSVSLGQMSRDEETGFILFSAQVEIPAESRGIFSEIDLGSASAAVTEDGFIDPTLDL